MLLLFAQLGILIVLVVLNIWFGIEKGLYETIWWWDIVTHFLGGAWAGLFGAWVLRGRARMFVLQCAVVALSIGIAWEIFELYFNLGGSDFMSYSADTAKDLFFDTIGGTIAGIAVLLERELWKRK